MVGREEICKVIEYLIKALQASTSPDQNIKIMGETTNIGNLTKHVKELHAKLVSEQAKTGAEGQITLTHANYKALIAKVQAADEVLKVRGSQ